MKFLALFICYIIGSIPFGLMAGKLVKGIDIRDYGSGNIGATNVLRTLGTAPAVFVFLLDVCKGWGSVYLCRSVFGLNEYYIVAGGLIAIIGHSCSIFLKFKGGKGISTSLGLIIGLNPLIAAIAFGIWTVIVAITRYVSLASIIACIAAAVMMAMWKEHISYQFVTDIATLFIIIKHKENIKRLLAGTENKFGQRVKIDEEKAAE